MLTYEIGYDPKKYIKKYKKYIKKYKQAQTNKFYNEEPKRKGPINHNKLQL